LCPGERHDLFVLTSETKHPVHPLALLKVTKLQVLQDYMPYKTTDYKFSIIRTHASSLNTCMPTYKKTYDDEEYEVDEVVEGMSVHDVVHDLHPTL